MISQTILLSFLYRRRYRLIFDRQARALHQRLARHTGHFVIGLQPLGPTPAHVPLRTPQGVSAGRNNRAMTDQRSAARVLQVWRHVDSAAEFVDDSLMSKMRAAMAELDAAVGMSG